LCYQNQLYSKFGAKRGAHIFISLSLPWGVKHKAQGWRWTLGLEHS